MESYSDERRARFVMFLGIGMLAIFIFLGEVIEDSLGYRSRWLIEDGWLHGLAALLILLGAWKWLNAREDLRNKESEELD